MSLSETKRLLRNYRIVPNKLLGQNFMVEPEFYSKLSKYADLNHADVVLDAGAGFGFLTLFIAEICKAVVAVEKDDRIAEVLREQVKRCSNVRVLKGDILKIELPGFSKLVSIPPYYLSRHLVMWLLERKVDCAVLILQSEFAEKLVASVGSDNYGWLTVLAFNEAKVDLLDPVPKSMFYPQPKVDSVIVRLTRRKAALFQVENEIFFHNLVRWLFTQRNKKIRNALLSYLRNTRRIDGTQADRLASGLHFGDKRVRELSPQEFGEVAGALDA